MRLSHPVIAGAIGLLVLNDHVLKHACPGFVTGKLSDVAGMIFFPVLLAAIAERLLRRRDLLLASCLVTAAVFALVKTVPEANVAYRVTWGAMQWPFFALRALATGRALPRIARVVLVRDPTDLAALPFVALAWRFGRERGGTMSAWGVACSWVSRSCSARLPGARSSSTPAG